MELLTPPENARTSIGTTSSSTTIATSSWITFRPSRRSRDFLSATLDSDPVAGYNYVGRQMHHRQAPLTGRLLGSEVSMWFGEEALTERDS